MIQAVGCMNKMTELHLEDCDEIDCLINNTLTHAPSFSMDNVFATSLDLTLERMSNLKEVCRGPPLQGFFQILERLQIGYCGNLGYIFPAASKLGNLKYLKIENCPKLMSLFPMSSAQTMLKLEAIELRNCELLEHIITNGELEEIISNGDGEDKEGQLLNPSNYNSCPQQVCFPKLEQLEVVGCNKLKSVFPVSMAGVLPQLEDLTIESCSKLEQVFDGKYHKPVSGQSDDVFRHKTQHINEKIELPNLRMMRLEKLPALVEVCQGMKLHAVVLERITIIECPEFAPVSESFDLMAATFISFSSLLSLEVDGCRKLKSIFSATVIKSLPQLVKLHVRMCKELEEIISNGDGEDKEGQLLNPSNYNSCLQQVCFPKLVWLHVSRCNKLKSIFPVSMAGHLPQLEDLAIESCSKLEQVFDGKYHKPEATQLEEVFRQETQPIKEKIELPNLSKIKLEELPALVDVCLGMKLHAVVLENITIKECPKFAPVSESFDLMALEGKNGHVSNQLSDFQTGSSQGTQEMFVISIARWLALLNLNDLMFVWKGPTFISFKSLEYLKLDGCRKLKSIFSATVVRSFPRLGYLEVYTCEELEEIISDGDGEDKQGQFLNPSNSRHPHQLCYPKLNRLEVVGCNKLKCLFPVSMAGDLPQLKDLIIESCSKLEQVFGSESEAHDAGLEPQLWFHALEIFEMKNCPNFSTTSHAALIGRRRWRLVRPVPVDDIDDNDGDESESEEEEEEEIEEEQEEEEENDN